MKSTGGMQRIDPKDMQTDIYCFVRGDTLMMIRPEAHDLGVAFALGSESAKQVLDAMNWAQREVTYAKLTPPESVKLFTLGCADKGAKCAWVATNGRWFRIEVS